MISLDFKELDHIPEGLLERPASALYQQIDGTAYLRDKSIAQWVASNKLAESRILLSAEIGIPPHDPMADELLRDSLIAVVAGAAYGLSPYFRISTATTNTEVLGPLLLLAVALLMEEAPHCADAM